MRNLIALAAIGGLAAFLDYTSTIAALAVGLRENGPLANTLGVPIAFLIEYTVIILSQALLIHLGRNWGRYNLAVMLALLPAIVAMSYGIHNILLVMRVFVE